MTGLNNSLETYFEKSCLQWQYKEDEKFEHYYLQHLSSGNLRTILEIFNQHSMKFLISAEKETLKIFFEKQ